ncbi:MAG: TIGR03750 family conjugal transfer protein [Cellvibrionaceae bacterium]|nr:TIGR03750 family conjugal transfer protein [Cellvibrionaceae bacterium]
MDERLADNINDDPVVYMDCTMPQILWTGVAATMISLFFGFFIGMLFSSFTIGAVVGILASLGLSWLGLTLIQNLRHANFDGWLNEKLFLIKHDLFFSLGFTESKLIRGSERLGKGARK